MGVQFEMGATAMGFGLDGTGVAETLEQTNDCRKVDAEKLGQLTLRMLAGFNRRNDANSKIDRNGSHLPPPCKICDPPINHCYCIHMQCNREPL
jgi:hypothetical protein